MIFSARGKSGHLERKNHGTENDTSRGARYRAQNDCMMNRKITRDPERSGSSGSGIKTGKHPHKDFRTLTYTDFC